MDAGFSSTASSAASVLSSASTDATSLSRDSSATDDTSFRESAPSVGGGPGSKSENDASSGKAAKDDTRYLHSQIEDLLTALSELQRDHATLTDQLQKEKEDRDDDRRAVRALLDGLRKKSSSETVTAANVDDGPPSEEQLSELLDRVEDRFTTDPKDNRRSSVPQTKLQLRDDLARAKEQLSNEFAKSQDNTRRMYDLEQELNSVKEQLNQSRSFVRNLHDEKQRLGKQIQGLRARASDTPTSGPEGGDWFSRTTGMGNSSGPASGGLRELKLGRSRSTPSQVTTTSSKRISSMMMRGMGDSRESLVPASTTPPTSEHDALLLELVQAKTAEAIARQEAEEAKQKLENLRKAFGLAPGDMPSAAHQSTVASTAASQASAAASAAASQASAAATAAIGMFGRLTGSANATTTTASSQDTAASTTKTVLITTTTATNTPNTATATTGPAANNGGGFWGWRR
jgi:hypothetical protein